jgi:BirA family transcriptional regulator, biotin operon repressor / biotin---[acetyl-CoA-carboxylase] ligase
MNELRLEKIQENLFTEYTGKNMVYFKQTISTNSFAAGLAREAEKFNKGHTLKKFFLDGAVIIAEKQLRGRGRFERGWVSPENGLWFTIINKPATFLKNLPGITIMAAVSVFSVIKRTMFACGSNLCEKLKIKWPNDIYYNGKKLAGILCESEKLNNTLYLLTGIGINVNFSAAAPIFSGLNAVSLYDITGRLTNRNILLAHLLNEFEKNYSCFIKTGDTGIMLKKIDKSFIL